MSGTLADQPGRGAPAALAALDKRSREIFREIVEAYLATGEPVGSRTLSKRGGVQLSAASIRNTMADLTQAGLLTAPHVSAGRLPTHQGLRLFVDALMEFGDLTEDERGAIESLVGGSAASMEDVLERATDLLSGLAGAAGLVVTPTRDAALRHVELVSISPEDALGVLVFEDGSVENRLIPMPPGLTPSAMTEAGNYLSRRLKGRTLAAARAEIEAEIAQGRAQLDLLAAGLIRSGLAAWAGGGDKRALIVRGHAKLLGDVAAAEDVERMRGLFDELERKTDVITLLDQARAAQSVKIFIGAENPLFSLSGSSVIAAPYMNKDQRIVGALGVIGPTRLNYARVIPLVDYTARVVSKILDEGKA